MPRAIPLLVRQALWSAAAQGASTAELADRFDLPARSIRHLLPPRSHRRPPCCTRLPLRSTPSALTPRSSTPPCSSRRNIPTGVHASSAACSPTPTPRTLSPANAPSAAGCTDPTSPQRSPGQTFQPPAAGHTAPPTLAGRCRRPDALARRQPSQLAQGCGRVFRRLSWAPFFSPQEQFQPGVGPGGRGGLA